MKYRFRRSCALLLSLLVTQSVLLGPMLVGLRVAAPLDQLADPALWMPATDQTPAQVRQIHQTASADATLGAEPQRRFATDEIRRGRIPLWNPYNFCGSPFLAANGTQVFSLYRLSMYLLDHWVMLAWMELAKALVLGAGMYLLLRRTLRVGFWPALVLANVSPWAGFMVLWWGVPLRSVYSFAPWLLLAVHAAVRRPGGWGGPLLAVVTALVLYAGHAAAAGHVLLLSGVMLPAYLVERHGWRGLMSRASLQAIAAVLLGWLLGIALSMPQTLPTLEYMQHSYRVQLRSQGMVEFSPDGWVGLVSMLNPFFEGRWFDQGFLLGQYAYESSRQGYAGWLVALVLAPMTFIERRRRGWAWFWLVLGVVAAASCLNIPLLADLFAQYPARLFRNNRLIFVTAIALLMLGGMGLDTLRRRRVRPGWWMVAPIAACAIMAGWAASRWWYDPASLREGIAWFQRALAEDPHNPSLLARLQRVQSNVPWFRLVNAATAIAAMATILLLVALSRSRSWRRPVFALTAVLVVAEPLLLWQGVLDDADPRCFYPQVPILEKLRQAPAGRVIGFRYLPPVLNLMAGLHDLRGYDAVDMGHYVELLHEARDPQLARGTPYCPTKDWVPRSDTAIPAMLNLRYVIYRGEPPKGITPYLAAPGHWVQQRAAMPRVWVPQQVEHLPDSARTLRRLGASGYRPDLLAFSAQPLNVQPGDICRGQATIVDEDTQRVRIHATMQTPGLLVLADTWYPGWTATVAGRELPVLRVNHALRGVELPAGNWTVEFRYAAPSFWRGVMLMGAATAIWTAWLLALLLVTAPGRAGTPTAVPSR